MKTQENAAGLVRIGLAICAVGVLWPIYQRAMHSFAAPGSDGATLLFRGGIFAVVLGVALRNGWMRSGASQAARDVNAAAPAHTGRG